MTNSKRRCSGCREYFTPEQMLKGTGLQAFCSQACMLKKQRTKKKTKSNVPGTTRQKVFERFRHMCAYCGRSGRGLHVHHIKYRSEGVDHSLDNLILLCQEHHDLVHSNKKFWQPLLREYVAGVVAGTMRPHSALAKLAKEREDEDRIL